MNNAQTAAARAVLNRYPDLKVTIGRTEAGETLTPYLASDVFVRGSDVVVTANMTPEQITAAFTSACATLMASANG